MTNKCNKCNNEYCPDNISEKDKQKYLQRKVHLFIIGLLILLILLKSIN